MSAFETKAQSFPGVGRKMLKVNNKMLKSLIPAIIVFVGFVTLASAQELIQVGDMLLTKDQQKLFGATSRNGLEGKKYIWPDNTVNVYYNDFDSEEFKNRFESAAAEIMEAAPCIKFKYWTSTDFDSRKSNKLDFVHVYENPYAITCHSSVGYERFAWRTMDLSSNGTFCNKQKMLHALLHILGFFHMDNSADRDNYVTIDWGNLNGRDRGLGLFNVIPSGITRFGTLYDYTSIMHEGPYSSSIEPGKKKTIIAKAPSGEKKYGDPNRMGQREAMSLGDKIRLRSLYSCKNP